MSMRVSDFKKLPLVASSSSLEGITELAKKYSLSDVELSPNGDEFRVYNKRKDIGLIIKLVGRRWQMRRN